MSGRTLIVCLGDQIYADDPSPKAQRRMKRRRRRRHEEAPDDVAADFEEYRNLYLEAWTPDVERWLLSVVPSTMIFDDHDMIDDWNISLAWVDDIRTEPWWREHIVGGLVSYWIYQHLGNLDPDRIEEEGLLGELLQRGRRRTRPAAMGRGVGGVHAGAGRLPLQLHAGSGTDHAGRPRLPERA